MVITYFEVQQTVERAAIQILYDTLVEEPDDIKLSSRIRIILPP